MAPEDIMTFQETLPQHLSPTAREHLKTSFDLL